MAKKIGIVVACVALIAVSVYIALPPRRLPKVNPEDYRRPWVCDACGHTFRELPGPGLRPCPKCGELAGVQSIIYTCGKCGAEFEAYRLKDMYGATAEQGADAMGSDIAYAKKAGGEWTTVFSILKPIKCPKCGNTDPATLKEKLFGPGLGGGK